MKSSLCLALGMLAFPVAASAEPSCFYLAQQEGKELVQAINLTRVVEMTLDKEKTGGRYVLTFKRDTGSEDSFVKLVGGHDEMLRLMKEAALFPKTCKQ